VDRKGIRTGKLSRTFGWLAVTSVLLGATGLAIPSTANAQVAADSPPGSPTGVTGVPGNGTVTVSWNAPASDGGSAVTGYTVTAIPGGATATAGGSTTTATVTGLTNGNSYRFTVTATNAAGTSPPSASSDPVTPEAPSAPGAPAITGVTARDSAVDVSWSAPSLVVPAISGYTIHVHSGGSQVATVTEAASATEATVSGLTNGTQYVFTITAKNSSGTSPASPPSPPVTPRPATVPMAPAGAQVFPQDGEIQVGWSAPPDGGSPITGYTVSVSPATVPPVSTSGDTTVATVSGLTNGTAYTVSITATNAAGTGPAATPAAVTPETSIPPSAPGNLTAVVTASGTVGLQWTPPATSGTSAITGYTVTASPGGNQVTSDQCGSTAPVECSATMTGLSATTAYTFTVTAASTAGSSTASTATQAVTPALVVKTTPVVLSAASVTALRSAGTDGTLIFEQPPAQVTSLKKGNLVQVNPATVAPGGYLGTVQATSTEGGLFVVTTKPTSLDSEYSTFEAALNVPFSPASVDPLLPGVRLSRPERAGRPAASAATPAGVSWHWQNDSLVLELQTSLLGGDSTEGEDSSPDVGPMAEIDGNVTLTPILTAFDQNGFVGLTVGGSVSADLTAKFGVELSADQTVPLAVIPGVPIETEIGEVTPELTVAAVLNTDGSVGISYGVHYNATATGTCMIRKSLTSHSGDTCTGIHTQSATETHTEFYGDMNVTAGIQFGAELNLDFDLLEAGLTLTPGIVLAVDTTANPWWTVSLQLDLGVVVKFLTVPIYQDTSVISFSLVIDQASGAFTGLFITPPVANVAPGKSQAFQAATATGPVTTTDWSVIAGPGSISSSGTYSAPKTAFGTAVIQATFNGETARAGVVLQGLNPPKLDIGTRGLVDGLVASWSEPKGTQPASYQVIAYDLTPAPGVNPGTTKVVPAPENLGYIPGLQAGQEYLVGVIAYTGTVTTGSTESASKPAFLTALAAQPSVLAGTGFDGDIATSPATQQPDDTGTAGNGGAVISGNGQYAFFYTESRSDLAPADAFGVGNESVYLVREDLATHVIDTASIGLNGQPVTALNPESAGPGSSVVGAPPSLVTNDSGTAVAFVALSGEALVYNFLSNTTWQIDAAAGAFGVLLIGGLSDSGDTADYVAGASGGISTVYLQTSAGSPQAIGEVSEVGAAFNYSMSADGTLIAYTKYSSSGFDSIYLYDASTGTNTDLFPANTTNRDNLDAPVLSPDGSHIALFADLATGQTGIAIKTISSGTSTTVTASNIKIHGINDVPVAASAGATTLIWDDVTGKYTQVAVYSGGKSRRPPIRSDAYPESVSLTDTGSTLLYTLWFHSTDSTQTKFPNINFPGVFEWQLG
jgi:Fibronectin type III domain